jgi:hypothetical protein
MELFQFLQKLHSPSESSRANPNSNPSSPLKTLNYKGNNEFLF